jgi:hypothetical protein
MSILTPILNLFKWDTDNPTDLESQFDLGKAINDNWDKIDTAVGLTNTAIEEVDTRVADINTELETKLQKYEKLGEMYVSRNMGAGVVGNSETHPSGAFCQIDTNMVLDWNTSTFYRVKLSGYLYGERTPVDCEIVGYWLVSNHTFYNAGRTGLDFLDIKVGRDETTGTLVILIYPRKTSYPYHWFLNIDEICNNKFQQEVESTFLETNSTTGVGIITTVPTAVNNIITGQEIVLPKTYNGKQVYSKEINCGAMPNNTTKQVSTGLTNVTYLELSGRIVSTGGVFFPMNNSRPYDGTDAGAVGVYLSLNDIIIESKANRSTYTGYATVEYIKN